MFPEKFFKNLIAIDIVMYPILQLQIAIISAFSATF